MFDACREQADVVRRVAVAGDAEVDVSVVGEDRDPYPHRAAQRDERESLEHAPSGQVQRMLRSGHVRGDGVQSPLRDAAPDAASQREQHGGREAAERRQPRGRHRLAGGLELLHLRAHSSEALDGVVDADRQLGEHRRDLVVVVPPLVLGAHRHRHERADRALLDVLAAGQQQLAKAAGDRGQHDVVDRSSERLADLLDLDKARPRPVPAPVRADGAVQRRGAARHQQLAQVGKAAARLEQLACEPARAAHRGKGRAHALIRRHSALEQRVARQPHPARFALGLPCVHTHVRALTRRVEQHAQQIGRRHAVHHAVVDLRDHRPAPGAEAFGDPHLPQRLAAIELLGHHASHEVAQLLVTAGRWQRGAAHVVVEPEVWIVHPHGPAERERHEAHSLAVAGHQRQVRGDRFRDVIGPRRGTLEDPDRADVHVRDLVLDVKERGVEWAHRLHGCSSTCSLMVAVSLAAADCEPLCRLCGPLSSVLAGVTRPARGVTPRR